MAPPIDLRPSLHSKTLQRRVLLRHAQPGPDPEGKQLLVQPAMDAERSRGHGPNHRLLAQRPKGEASLHGSDMRSVKLVCGVVQQQRRDLALCCIFTTLITSESTVSVCSFDRECPTLRWSRVVSTSTVLV